jgi:hypothetical protein
MTRSRVGGAAVVVVSAAEAAAFTEEVAVGSTAAACMPDVSTVAAAIAVACVRHIPSQAAQGADMPVVPVVRSQVVPAMATGEGIIVADMVRQRR